MSRQSVATPSIVKLRIEGMDCAACAVKIENAMKRLPGVADINVSYTQERLSISLDADRTSESIVEGRIRALGYKPVREDTSSNVDVVAQRIPRATWWRTPKGRLTLGIGALYLTAVVFAVFAPGLALWAYSAAALVSIIPFARRAYAGVVSGTPFSIEMLMSVAAAGALIIGAAEEAAVVILLFAVGELLETIAAGRARAGIEALINLAPKTAFVERAGGINQVSVNELSVGDMVVVRPGDRIPSDGVIRSGASEIDQSPVTGESVPVPKQPGDNVYAGSINANAELRIEITHVAADNTISRIIHMVEEAQASKAPTARVIDRFSAWYTPAAMGVSLLVIVVPPLLFGADWMTWTYRGLATLLIACPCALVISTPAAIASGLAAGARRGLLIKGGAPLEMLGKVKTVAFDKTGTLTEGQPSITDIIAFAGDEATVLARAAAVERTANHPLGLAIVAEAERRALEIPAAFGGAVATPGKAVTTRLKDAFVSVGSPRFAAERTTVAESIAARIAELEGAGKTVVVVVSGKRIEGLIALRDQARGDAVAAIARLHAWGIATIMLTGDNSRTASAIARQLGLEVRAELLPDAKLEAIADLKKQGPVAMVGDGINDAPALAAASVGIAMGGGTDVALETAEVALLQNRVRSVAEVISLSRATLGNVWQNIALALGLKAAFLITTILGVTTLWMAILADTGATVLVTANALRLLRWGRR
jgi:Cd2+/Zn2+-exporting ATPase